MPERNIIQVTPFMHVVDLEGAVRFFEGILDFTPYFRMRDHAYLEREGAGMRVLSNDDPSELGVPHSGEGAWAFA